MVSTSPDGKLIALFSKPEHHLSQSLWKILVVSIDFQTIFADNSGNKYPEFDPVSIEWYLII